MRPFIPVVEAREDIPLDKDGWECPYCAARLPKQKVRVRHLSVDHHHRTAHPRVSAKKWKAKMVSVRFKGKKKSTDFSSKLSDHSAKERTKKFATHKVVKVPVTSEKAAEYRRDLEFWCMNCLTKVGGYGGGSRVRHEKLTCAQSRKLPHTRARILAAWKRLEGRADVSGVLVHVQASEWVRRLVEDGDIERQPGPSKHPLMCLR